MKRENTITILGSGTSTGIPTLGCQCDVCTSTNKKNKRFRTSALITTTAGKKIIIDTTPDMRTQLLKNHIQDIDAAIITHEHADHTHGIDDLRPYCFFKHHPIPVFTYDKCKKILEEKFPYIFQADRVFKNKKILGGGIPKLTLQALDLNSPTEIQGENFEFSLMPHGYTQTLGILTGKLAYITDCHDVPDDFLQKCQQRALDVLIIDTVRRKPHQTHLHLDKAIDIAKKIGAKKTGLTHLSHSLEHETLKEELIERGHPHIFPLYDGQKLSFNREITQS